MERRASGRPQPGEYAAYAQADIDLVPGDDAIAALHDVERETLALLAPLAEETIAGLAYAPGKWTLKEVIGHLIDDERIFAYRALCVARGDTTPLPGFDEKLYAASAASESRTLADLLEEYRDVRRVTIRLFASLPDEAWLRRGTTNGYSASPRGLAFHIAAHELHHLRIVRERYLR
jgi:uncharacterized damage-inducible protein DinB